MEQEALALREYRLAVAVYQTAEAEHVRNYNDPQANYAWILAEEQMVDAWHAWLAFRAQPTPGRVVPIHRKSKRFYGPLMRSKDHIR